MLNDPVCDLSSASLYDLLKRLLFARDDGVHEVAPERVGSALHRSESRSTANLGVLDLRQVRARDIHPVGQLLAVDSEGIADRSHPATPRAMPSCSPEGSQAPVQLIP